MAFDINPLASSMTILVTSTNSTPTRLQSLCFFSSCQIREKSLLRYECETLTADTAELFSTWRCRPKRSSDISRSLTPTLLLSNPPASQTFSISLLSVKTCKLHRLPLWTRSFYLRQLIRAVVDHFLFCVLFLS